MSEDDFVHVEWNEMVTFAGRISREDMKKTMDIAEEFDKSPLDFILDNAIGVKIIDGKGAENFVFIDNDLNQIGKL